MEIREIPSEERTLAVGLIEASRLPQAGLEDAHTQLWAARSDGVLVGVCGLESYGEVALLRSVATDAKNRGRGIASALCRAVLEAARAQGVQRVFLLTETAESFFRRLGFESLEREHADPRLLDSAEFQENRCASAQLMAKRL